MTLSIRPVVSSDADLLFDWVNRPDSLAASLRTEQPVQRPEHDRWFAARLNDDDAAIFVAEDDDGPVGQVRLQHTDGGTEVSIYVAEHGRRRGVAMELLTHGRQQAKRRWPGSRLIARVKSENAASRQLFERAGYRLQQDIGDHLVLERECQ